MLNRSKTSGTPTPGKTRRPLLKTRYLFLIAACLWPLTARADVGTPLIWASAFHLFIGNALIGLFEGYLLARFFELPRRRACGCLIAANYVSMWAGSIILPRLFYSMATDIYNALRITWALVGISYLLTLGIEWPFVALAFRRKPNWLKASIKGSLLIQTASYLILFGGYWSLSGTSLYSKFSVVPPAEMAKPDGIAIFFISSKDGGVYRCTFAGSSDEKVFDLKSTN